MSETYDLAVIGAGPGGYIAALKAAEFDGRVALIEKSMFGGTCLNLGCIPTKTLYQSSQNFVNYLQYARALKDPFARDKHLAQRAFKHAMDSKDKVIEALRKQINGFVKHSAIDVYRGSAYLDSQNEVTIDGQQTIRASKIILATGSTPMMPPKFDLDRTKIMTSNEILNLRELPESILIVGGGYIGCEYATIFANYGVDVTLIELLPGILNTEDGDIVNEVLKSFKKKGVSVLTKTGLDSIEIDGGKVTSALSNGHPLQTDLVLVAVGRSPNSHGLGLEKLGIELNEKGAVGVNERFRTNRNDVYAIGDVIDRELRLAHVSEKEGIFGIAGIIRDKCFGPMSYEVIPTAIFVEPEVASVGKREFQLNDKGTAYVVGKSWYEKNAMAMCSGNTTGFVKLIVDKTTLKILGSTVVGNHASDLIGIIATAMNAEATVETLANSVWFHPSRPEVIKGAAEVALRKLKMNVF